jgi:hypothetical protein
MRREIVGMVAALDSMNRWTISHNIDARRYGVARSEASWGRCPSIRNSRLRPKVASIETSTETEKLDFSWRSEA